MGGEPHSFAGLTGVGDLMATCSSPQSRNRFVGAELADTARLSVFDLQTWGELPLEVYAQDTANALMQARVAGDLAVWLLAYDRHDGEGRDVEIHYAELPPPG
jgi:glycerol-3-phosphate dehydrogenase